MQKEMEALKLDREELEEFKELERKFKAGLCFDCGRPAHGAFKTWCVDCAAYHGYQVCSRCGMDSVHETRGDICYDCYLETCVAEELEARIGIEIQPERSYKVVIMRPEEAFTYRFVVPDDGEEDIGRLVSRAQAALARMYNSPVSVQIGTITGKWLLMCYHSSKEFGNERYYYALSNEAVTALEA